MLRSVPRTSITVSALSSIDGYVEANPDKKNEVNGWLSRQNYIQGKAIYLDAKDMKTSEALKDRFRLEDMVIPEYDTHMYEENRRHSDFGECVFSNDFLSELKEWALEDMSLIYADCLGRYEKATLPILEYLESNTSKIQKGMILGVTFSQNGAGNRTTRDGIIKQLDRIMIKMGFVEIDKEMDESSVNETEYGTGHMCVYFYIKQ